tara:strand:+ start:927 stop:1757 length:831 start_codon:yes stop_codon:yes gene_type:complete
MKNIHKTAKIGKNVIIECNNFTLGKNSIIKDGCIIRCNNFIAGEGLYMCEGVEVGRGGCFGPNSNVYIGDNVGIFENTVINPSDEVHIGNNVGIGGDVMIWTHGAWLDVLKGFPADFGPVKIGNDVWLPARCIVLPNVDIGDNAVIGIGSIINRNIPSGCFAAGSPCRVIKKECYPRELSKIEKQIIVDEILSDWYNLHESKGIKDLVLTAVKTSTTKEEIILTQGDNSTIYDLEKRTISGYINEVSEDLRDYLRRRGIKIFTDIGFSSIKSEWQK